MLYDIIFISILTVTIATLLTIDLIGFTPKSSNRINLSL